MINSINTYLKLKACVILIVKNCSTYSNLKMDMEQDVKGLGQVGMCYKEWKDWCLKDE